MCDKEALESSEENSGQIEDISDCVYKYNLVNVNDVNSLIIMGRNTETICNGVDGVVNIVCKHSVNNDECLNCDDIGTNGWVKQRTSGSVDLDVIRCNDLEDCVAINYSVASSKDVEGYCIVDSFGHIQSVLTNLDNGVPLVSDVSKLADQYCHLPVEQSISNEGSILTVNKDVTEPLIERLENAKLLEKSSVKITNGVADKYSNIPQNLNNIVVSEHLQINTSDSKKSTNLPFVKIPKKYILSGKIISQNLLPTVSRQRQISILNHKNKRSNNVIKQKNHTSLLKNKTLPVLSNVLSKDLDSQTFSLLNKPQSVLKYSNTVEKKKTYKKSVICDTNVRCDLKKTLPLATVAISTNKSNDTTEIVIKMDKGQELYKGKASDLVKAVNNCVEWKCSNVKTNYDGSDLAKEDEPVMEALKSLGITRNQFDSMESTSSGQKIWLCPLQNCKYNCMNISWLKIHILAHYVVRPFKCDYEGCSWSFYTHFHLKRHKETHLKKKLFKCKVDSCDRSFTTVYNLNTHMKLHERPAELVCPVDNCGQAFQTRRSLEVHIKSHGIDHAPYVCNIEGCGKRYYTMNALHSHNRTHQHAIEDLQCRYCQKVFDKPCRLRGHVLSHTGVKPYKCDFQGCEWAFTTSSKLRRHQRKHTQERKFTCIICSKTFLRSEHLKDHSLKHFVSKSFICPIAGCGISFTAKSSLYVHLKKHRAKTDNEDIETVTSTENIIYPCPVDSCNMAYTSKRSIRTHLQLCHMKTGDGGGLDGLEHLSDDNIMPLEGFQCVNEVSVPAENSGNSVTFNNFGSDSFLAGLPDLISCNPSSEQDYTNSASPNLVTHIVLSDTQNEEQCIQTMIDGEEQIVIMEEQLEDQLSTAISNFNVGCARTHLTYQDTMLERESRKSVIPSKKNIANGRKHTDNVPLTDMDSSKKEESLCLDSPAKDNVGLRVASDVVLAAGLLGGSQDNLARSLLLQDDLSSGDLYSGSQNQEDSGLLGAGELQVLLLDSTNRHSDFEQSTINLRDLE